MAPGKIKRLNLGIMPMLLLFTLLLVSLWLLSDAYLVAGDIGAARLIEIEAMAATISVKNGYDRTAIQSDNALRLGRRGYSVAARSVFAMALANGRNIKTPWWRARAFARLASALGALERLGIRP